MQNYKKLSKKFVTFVLLFILAMPVILAAQSISGNLETTPVIKSQSQTGIELIQNTPNPLNPTTSVDFTLPKDSKVSLKICDAENKEVITLLDDEITAGFHSVQFYVPGITSGTYYYSLIAESEGTKTVVKDQMHFTE